MPLRLKNKKVIIMGLGLHGGGLSSALFFAKAGARVLVTDLKSQKELAKSLKKLQKYKNISFLIGRHRSSDFEKADLIIRNPAVPNDSKYLEIARKHNVPIHTDISYFLLSLQTTNYQLPTIIGITGTKGKSTTAALLHHALVACGKKALLAGNIRKSPLDFIRMKNSNFGFRISNFIVLELSSWHLESLDEHRLAPHIAIITNILPDHLNRYKNFNEYIKAKQLIYRYQTPSDLLFGNSHDPILRHFVEKNRKKIKPHIVWYAGTKKPVGFLHPDTLSAVLKVSKYLELDQREVAEAITSFKPLEGRLEMVETVNGVHYYNDTCATQPDAAVFAIETVKNKIAKGKGKIILIAGGEDKELNYQYFTRAILKNIHALILFKGSASDKMITLLKTQSAKTLKQWGNITKMEEAVYLAYQNARRGDIVLLSPGAASFGLFLHEFDRGERFVKAVSLLKKS